MNNYLVKAKAVRSFLYKEIELEYGGKKQCKIGDIITLDEKTFGGSGTIFRHTFKIVQHTKIP